MCSVNYFIKGEQIKPWHCFFALIHNNSAAEIILYFVQALHTHIHTHREKIIHKVLLSNIVFCNETCWCS